MAARLGRPHLALAAGCLGVLAMVGASIGAAATLPVSSEKLTSVAQGGTVPPLSDTTPPQLSTLEFFDANSNGKIDRVVATFTDASDLAPYTAGTTPWSLSGQPAGVTLASVSVATGTKTATLTLTEGTAFDTAATGFQVSMAANAAGIRDVHGNQATFSATTVTDRAGPVPWRTTLVNGGTAGRVEKGDAVEVTWSEALAPASVCSDWTAASTTYTVNPGGTNQNPALVTITNGVSPTPDVLTVAADNGACGGTVRFGSLNLGVGNYVTSTASWGANGANRPGVFTYTTATRTIRVQLGDGPTGPVGPGTAHSTSFQPSSGITDGAGNAANGSVAVPSTIPSRF